MRLLAPLALSLAMAGCASTPATPRPGRAPFVPIPTGTAGLQGVMGRNSGQLTALLGQPVADVREGAARKLQFRSGTCVLDTYLYPRNGGEPVVTYLDARQPDGSPIDRASCVAAFSIRRGG
ncbi:hypothetical protein DVW87_01320 [Sphingomonas aracearum]|uniref:Uncharacterized protein n=1 Tax=Sphingomonas aracearum TaxID=2283317 RepID=A0A369VYD8_9SPHN|nr:hypothetical protein [Sphingomonas aracearum]RDE07414.1 hypothetical protein DVW87_01320 [Sphingomonas aracearum]